MAQTYQMIITIIATTPIKPKTTNPAGIINKGHKNRIKMKMAARTMATPNRKPTRQKMKYPNKTPIAILHNKKLKYKVSNLLSYRLIRVNHVCLTYNTGRMVLL